MRVRRHAPQQEETGIDLAPMERTSMVMNLLNHAGSGRACIRFTLAWVYTAVSDHGED